jgi:hypothetical protein
VRQVSRQLVGAILRGEVDRALGGEAVLKGPGVFHPWLSVQNKQGGRENGLTAREPEIHRVDPEFGSTLRLL